MSGSQTTFWNAYSFVPMCEKCPDPAESPRFAGVLSAWEGVGVEGVETCSVLRCRLQSLIYFWSLSLQADWDFPLLFVKPKQPR